MKAPKGLQVRRDGHTLLGNLSETEHMNSNMPQDQPPWKPGDIANGYVLGTDGVWRPIQSQAERPWTPGDVANGHVLGRDGVWRPVQPPQQWKSGDVANGHTLDHDNVWRAVPPQRRKSWYQRPM